MFIEPVVHPLRRGVTSPPCSAPNHFGALRPADTALPPVNARPRPACTNCSAQVASISGILHTSIKNIVNRYITIVNTIVRTIASHKGAPNHRNSAAKTQALKVPSVPADISNPSGAIDTVAARAKIVTTDMARRIFIRLFTEKNAVPLIAVKITTETTSTITAAQLSNPFPIVFIFEF